jgi:uncharacterized repeat protein (TIGR03803 family)
MIAAPGVLYDSFGNLTPQGLQSFGFVRIDENGKVAILHALSSNEGVPITLIRAADGNLYGIGSQGDPPTPPLLHLPVNAVRRVFATADVPSVLWRSLRFTNRRIRRNLYGTFSASGANGTGMIYRATPSGQLQILASFPSKSSDEGMSVPNWLVEASDYALYGSTVHNAIFRYDLATHALTLAYQMNPYNLQGSCAPCRLIQGMDGNLYGTAAIGGPGGGAVFSLDFGLPPPKPSIAQLVPSSGTVGQQILLWGGHLLGAASVTFNGVPAAAFQVNSTRSAALRSDSCARP